MSGGRYFVLLPGLKRIALVQEKKVEAVKKNFSRGSRRVWDAWFSSTMIFTMLIPVRSSLGNWLSEGVPLRLYYDKETKKLIAFYGGGFVRYSLGGKKEATIARQYPMVFSDDLSRGNFCQGQ